jgi:hypothetical protein
MLVDEQGNQVVQSWSDCTCMVTTACSCPLTPLAGERRQSTTPGPLSASEKAFTALDIYKMPILPTRWAVGDGTVPEVFKHAKVTVPAPAPRTRERKHRPRRRRARDSDSDDSSADERLGVRPSKPLKKERKERADKPYTGEGGARRMLARRRREDAEEKEKAQEDVKPERIAQDEASAAAADSTTKAEPAPAVVAAAPTPAPEPTAEEAAASKNPFDFSDSDSSFAPLATAAAAAPKAGGPSALRIGRQKDRGAHQASVRRRPIASNLAMAEDERVEVPVQDKPVSAFKPPTGFSFGPSTTTTTEVTSSHTLW